MALTCLLRLRQRAKYVKSDEWTQVIAGNSLDESPLLHHGFEAIRIGRHDLICLLETELNWVVTAVKGVVKGGLV